ncbi:alpha/beta hydrolase fold [Streptomyces sp. TLI_053]|uniref:alpha/beta hydrolase n=1 Tax=Streptomyces sp. TLI_053 TaxID=1855352 RepID=UPI00087AEB1C|nr:alpha/beta hydrolase [Streptomyces sp. TLI_053]SDS84811.1 alpha/beta hydrolase fold [Streptomyces sp. TLI_053]
MNHSASRRAALALVLSAAVVAPLAACGPDRTTTKAAPPATSAPATASPSASVTPVAPAEPADRPELAAFYRQQPAWKACGELQCATLTVPMDYRQPGDGRTFTLPLVRSAATDPAGRIGSLVFNPGGPGGSGVAHLKEGGAASFGDRVRARFDLVGFDPRGVAGSKPAVDCGSPEQSAEPSPAGPARNAVVPTTEAERQELLTGADRSAAACAARSAGILPHVGTPDAARDLDVLRAALGDPKLSYLGWSYGTYLGTVYGELFPQRARALVLDGAVDPAQDWTERVLRSGAAFRRAVDDYAEGCAAVVGRACPADSPEGIRRLVADLYESTARKPLKVDGSTARVDQNLLHNALTKAMYTPESQWKPLSEALRRAHRGNGTALAELAGGEAGGSGDEGTGAPVPDNSDAVLSAVNCLDVPHPADPQAYWNLLDRARQESGVFGAATALAELDCRTWPKGGTVPHRVTAAGLPPVLVVGTTGDPATPYEDAQSLAAQLPGGMLLTLRGPGHTAYGRGNACVDSAVDNYLTALTPVRPGTTC